MKKLLIPAAAILALSQNVFAAQGSIGSVRLESLSAIGPQYGSYLFSGIIEIKIKNGFQLPAGVFCDTNYITTRGLADPSRIMYDLLRDAMATNKAITLWITDNPGATAYPGRCSLLSVELPK